MPELPEIANLAAQMQAALTGKRITGVEVLQPKCLNLPEEAFAHRVTGAEITGAAYRGKWIAVATTQGRLWLNLNMGGEVLLVTRETLPEKLRALIDFDDGTTLAINFWWMGYLHHVAEGEAHKPTDKLGANALELTREELGALLKGRRGRIKNYLLDQSLIAGIGNFYVHDILFRARLHPLRSAATLGDADITALHAAIEEGLRPSLERGGAFYELDLHGKKGGYTMDDVLVGYKEEQPCPVCETPIEKLKTGSTSSYLCPTCQPLE